MATRSARMLSRHYAKLAAISSAPLILLILALAYLHYAEQRDQRLGALRLAFDERYDHLEDVLRGTERHVDHMRRWAEAYMRVAGIRYSHLLPLLNVEGGSNALDLTGYFLERDVDALLPEANGNFIGDGLALAGGHDNLRIVSLSLDIFSVQQLGHVALPVLESSYFLPERKHFLSIYPGRDRTAFDTFANGGESRALLDAFFSRRVYRRVEQALPAKSAPDWISMDKSPITGGRVVAFSAPVYDGNRLVGIVGADISQHMLRDMIRVPRVENVSAWLIDREGALLAGIGDGARADGQPPLAPAAAKSAAVMAGGFIDGGNQVVLFRPLGMTGWQLVYAAPWRDVNAGLLSRFLPYAMILAGLIATLIFAQLLVRSQLVQPVLAFAQYIRAGARGGDVRMPDAPRVWKPWVSVLQATFKRNREAIDRLRESETRYRQLVELSPDGVMLHDEKGIVFLNSAGCTTLGFSSPEQALEHSYMDFVPPAERQAAEKRVLAVLRDGKEIPLAERSMRTIDGRDIVISVTATPFIHSDRMIALVIFRDITARKAIEEAARQSEERLRAISQAVPVPVLISTGHHGRIAYANPEARRVLGITDGELAQYTIWNFCRDRAYCGQLSSWDRRARRIHSCEMEIRRVDGSLFPGGVTTVPMTFDGADAMMHAIVDLTERIHAEAELVQQREALHQKEKIAALGSLLAGVAHELNNPLSVVVGQALMLEEASPDGSLRDRARRIRDAAERCSRIVKTFLDMARSRAPRRDMVDLNDAVEKALDLASYSLKSSGVEVALELTSDLPRVHAAGDQLHHVISNLIINAEQAMKDVGGTRRITIRTGVETERRRVSVSVEDTGPGVAEADVTRIFEPFFTTKPEGLGTGIGLSVCRDIVASHGGEIVLGRGRPGGAVFTVYLPLRHLHDRTRRPVEEGRNSEAKGHVLVVDDDVEVANTLADVLRGAGHSVDIVYSGEDGLATARRRSYDLIISDIRMPGMDGPAFFADLRRDRKDLARRFVFVTGDTLGTDVATLVRETGVTLVEKPIDPVAITRLVGERLSDLHREPEGA